ncbi:MAG: type II secretion system minor pseudopilin GspI [Rhodothalassiaceae bacterium]
MDEDVREAGFSLIETMVALMLFALSALALMASATAASRHAHHLELRETAAILAENLLVERLAARAAPDIGIVPGESEIGGRHFRWAVRSIATEAPGMLRIEVDVLKADDGQLLASLSGFRRRRS